MQNKEERYFNAPIQLYKGFMMDSKKCLEDVISYAVYEHCSRNNDSDIKEAASYFGFSYTEKRMTAKDKDKILNGYKAIYDNYPNNSPKVGISTKIYWQYWNEDKTDFEKICLLAYLSIKSIVQNKSYCKIDNKFLLSRMDGNVSVIDLIQLSLEVKKFGKEYQLVKIKNELIKNWSLKHYSRYTRGFYVSFSMELEDLIYEAEKRRNTYLEKQQKELQNITVAKVLERLKNTTKHDQTRP